MCFVLSHAGVFSGIAPSSAALPSSVASACLQLLALATAGEELWQLSEVARHPHYTEQQPEPPAAAAAGTVDRPPDTCRRVFVGLDTSSVPEATAMLTAAQETGRMLMRGIKLSDADERQMQFVSAGQTEWKVQGVCVGCCRPHHWASWWLPQL